MHFQMDFEKAYLNMLLIEKQPLDIPYIIPTA
jgi:hypothetical protein